MWDLASVQRLYTGPTRQWLELVQLNLLKDRYSKTSFAWHNRLSNRLNNRLNVRLHDAAGCSTGCSTGLTTGWTTVCTTDNRLNSRLHHVNKYSTGCQTGCTTCLTTGWMFECWMFVYTMQPAVQPFWQSAVSCKRRITVSICQPVVDATSSMKPWNSAYGGFSLFSLAAESTGQGGRFLCPMGKHCSLSYHFSQFLSPN